jgi:hypothetical protein
MADEGDYWRNVEEPLLTGSANRRNGDYERTVAEAYLTPVVKNVSDRVPLSRWESYVSRSTQRIKRRSSRKSCVSVVVSV